MNDNAKQDVSSANDSDADDQYRILLVDDHPVTREGIASLLSRANLTVCGQVESAQQALDIIPKVNPHMAVVDITLKTTSGIELTKSIRAMFPKLPVLIMSMHDEALYAERALKAGARGYIMKQEASDNIIRAIHRVLHGELYLSDRIKDKLLHGLVSAKRDESAFSIDHLSDRELEVFRLIGNGYSTRQIAEKLMLSVKTIDSYREHLKIKLGLAKGADLVRHAIQWVKSEGLV